VQRIPPATTRVAIRLERSFELPFAGFRCPGVTIANAKPILATPNWCGAKARSVFYRGPVISLPGTPKLKVLKIRRRHRIAQTPHTLLEHLSALDSPPGIVPMLIRDIVLTMGLATVLRSPT